MPTCFRCLPSLLPLPWCRRLLPVALLLAAGFSRSSPAQVLARPGWAGSGVTVEAWWHRAVFYRIDVTRFQDSTGDGRGDLGGVVQRLGYLQSLGVDALIVDPGADAQQAGSSSTQTGSSATQTGSSATQTGSSATQPEVFNELTRQAAGDHLRIIVALGAPASQRSEATGRYLARARAWLNQGAAGLYVPTAQLAALGNPALAAYLVHQLRVLTNSFPGERILLADAAPSGPAALTAAVGRDAQLTVAPPIALSTPDAASLRRQMLAELPSSTSGSSAAANILLASRRLPANLSPSQRDGLERALAAVLLASRTAVLIDDGQELGEQEPASRQAAAGSQPLLMQWNPTNLTRKPKAAAEPSEKSSAPAYGVYQPFVKPLPRNFFSPPPLPDVELSETPPPVDPNSLPGFTSGEIAPALAAAKPPNGAAANVAVEDADPGSQLNLYRRLIQLHHENATLRSGAQEILDFDADGVLLWLRRPPPGARTSATVIVACNLSPRPFALSLNAIAQLHLRRASLLNLLSGPSPQPTGRATGRETTDALTLPAATVYLGEVNPLRDGRGYPAVAPNSSPPDRLPPRARTPRPTSR
jgi:hypothetical protein